MNTADQPKWLSEHISQSSDRIRHSTCTRCGAPILCARAGRVAALDVKADPKPLNPIEEILARLNGNLTWHLITTGLGYQRITWRGPDSIRAGPKPGRLVIADHTCPPQPIQETLL